MHIYQYIQAKIMQRIAIGNTPTIKNIVINDHQKVMWFLCFFAQT